ncbi:MAG: hypothetical protein IH989_08455 [Planctomycetes bacterium]|nr:hypothetical protein [Planctomycetota bacterium]
MTASEETKVSNPIKRLRFKPGTDLRAVDDLPYILQLAASLESLRAAIRWFEYVSEADTEFRGRDIVITVITGTGWCGETFCLLKRGVTARTVKRSMLRGAKDLEILWDRITSAEPDEMVRNVHRIRSNHFAHWNPKVFQNYVAWQSDKPESEAFVESDSDGKFLNTRYTWPWPAFMYDLVGDPNGQENQERALAMFREMGTLWFQTAGLIAHLIPILIQERGLSLEEVADS